MIKEIRIFYSKEDEGYICLIPEFSGLSAFGKTPQEALKEALIVYNLLYGLWIRKAGRRHSTWRNR